MHDKNFLKLYHTDDGGCTIQHIKLHNMRCKECTYLRVYIIKCELLVGYIRNLDMVKQHQFFWKNTTYVSNIETKSTYIC